jgi:hypothetical protein
MSEESTKEIVFTESPASWNTRYITLDGFTCQLTLRAEKGMELIERANIALTHLREQGCIPFYGYSKGNGNQRGSNNDSVWCDIHRVEMKRWEKDGKSWYSHQVNGEWCYGK